MLTLYAIEIQAMRLHLKTTKGLMMTVAVVAGALAIVMTSVSFDMDRAPNGPTSSVLTLDLNRLMAWAVVVIPILLLLKFWKSQAKR
jgi:hypothetical protein